MLMGTEENGKIMFDFSMLEFLFLDVSSSYNAINGRLVHTISYLHDAKWLIMVFTTFIGDAIIYPG